MQEAFYHHCGSKYPSEQEIPKYLGLKLIGTYLHLFLTCWGGTAAPIVEIET